MIRDETEERRKPLKAVFYRREVDGVDTIFCRVRISERSVWDQPLREADKRQFPNDWERFETQEKLRATEAELAKVKQRKSKAAPGTDEVAA